MWYIPDKLSSAQSRRAVTKNGCNVHDCVKLRKGFSQLSFMYVLFSLNIFFITHFRIVLSFQPPLDHNTISHPISIYLSVYRHLFLSLFLSLSRIYLSIYLTLYLSIYLSLFISFNITIHIYLSIYLRLNFLSFFFFPYFLLSLS